MLYCFLDTNIFLEFRPIKDIKWPKALGTAEVCLVVTLVVVRELNKHKAGNKNRLRKRARRSISFLKSLDWQADNEIRPNVTLRFDLTESEHRTLDEHNLSSDVNDDLLVAKALEFRSLRKTDRVAIVTDDAVVQFKAEGHDLIVPTLSDDWKLDDEPDPLVKKYQQLNIKYQELLNKQPKLKIGFHEDGGEISKCKHVCVRFVEDLINENEVDAAISESFEQLKFNPEKVKFNSRLDAYRQNIPYPNVTAQDIEKYHNRLEKWLYSDYRNYFIEDSLFRVFQDQSLELVLTLENKGKVPARNVEIDLEIQNCRTVLEHPPISSSYPDKSKPTAPPRSFSDIFDEVQLRQQWGNALFASKSLEIDTPDKKLLNFWLQELMHHRRRQLDKHYLIIDKPERFPSVVTIKCEIIAENIVDIVPDELKIIVNESDE